MERIEALRVLSEADCLANQQVVEDTIVKLARQITERIGKQNPLVLCIMNGGLIFTGQLLTRLNFPLEVGYLHVSRYGMASSGGELEWVAPFRMELSDRTVLLVDDILDEGVTLLALMEECRRRGAREVLSAVLVEKQHDRKARASFRADFTGLKVPDRFVFGYGLDYEGCWRNAPGIYAAKGM